MFSPSRKITSMTVSAVARTLMGGPGGIFIYSGSSRLTSFQINFISKETSRAGPEYMNIHPLATALITMAVKICADPTKIALKMTC